MPNSRIIPLDLLPSLQNRYSSLHAHYYDNNIIDLSVKGLNQKIIIMKKLKSTSIISAMACLMLLNFQSYAQRVTTPPGGGNQRSIATQYIGALVTVTVDYNSPDVHAPNGDDRAGKIWGQLVPYGMNNLGFGTAKTSPWRAGANQNSKTTFSHDVTVQGKALKAGTYGFHLVAEESGPWTIIFSNNSTAWGSFFYNPDEDALKVETTPEESTYQEWLTFEFIDRQPNSTTLALKWENKSIPFKIEVPNMNDVYIVNFRNELQSTGGFGWQGYNAAANFCLNNKINLDEALTWVNTSISAPFFGQTNFTNLSTKSKIQTALGKETEAAATMDLAIKHPTAGVFQIHGYGRRLVGQGKNKKALEIFKYNHKTSKAVWPTNYGLARGYSANKDHKNTVKYLKLALKNVPANDTQNPPLIEANIKKAEKGEDIN